MRQAKITHLVCFAWVLTVGLLLGATSAWSWVTPPNIHVPRGEQWTSYGVDQDPTLAFLGQRGLAVWNESDGAYSYSYRKWATTLDGGLSWSFGGDFWLPFPYSDETGHVRMCVDAAGTAYMTRLTNFGRVMLSKGRFTGDSFAWDSEFLILLTSGPLQEHPWLTCDRASGALYYVYSQFADFTGRTMAVFFARSLDAGATWTAPVALSGDSCTGARCEVLPDGSLVVSWTDVTRNQVLCRRSIDQGATFSSVSVIGPFDDNINTLPAGIGAGVVANLRYPYSYSFVNWPAIAVDRSNGLHRGRLFSAWVQRAQGTPGPITSSQGEVEPNDTPALATHIAIGMQFGGSIQSSDIGPNDPDYWAFDGYEGQTLMMSGTERFSPTPIDFVATGVQLFLCGPDTALIEIVRSHTTDGSREVPPMLFTLPSTGRYVMVVRGAGRYSVSYSWVLRDYAVSPTSVARDHRDVVLTWSDDGGVTWAPLRRVSDGPPRYADVLPELLVDDRGFVHLAWYDFREEPACGALAGVYWRVSTDGGESFLPSLRIASAPSTWSIGSGFDYSTVGDHLAMAMRGENIHFMWSDTRDFMATGILLGTEIYTAQVAVDQVTATEAAVAAFEASAEADGVRLRWRVEVPEQVREFRLHRAEGAGELQALDVVVPAPSRELAYEALDPTALAGVDHRYRLELVLRDGASRWSEVAAVARPAQPAALAWRMVQPNPSAGEVMLSLASPARSAVEVAVHDLRGARVATLHTGMLEPGTTRVPWNGRLADGSLAAPGVYLVRASGSAGTATQRVVRIR